MAPSRGGTLKDFQRFECPALEHWKTPDESAGPRAEKVGVAWGQAAWPPEDKVLLEPESCGCLCPHWPLKPPTNTHKGQMWELGMKLFTRQPLPVPATHRSGQCLPMSLKCQRYHLVTKLQITNSDQLNKEKKGEEHDLLAQKLERPSDAIVSGGAGSR